MKNAAHDGAAGVPATDKASRMTAALIQAVLALGAALLALGTAWWAGWRILADRAPRFRWQLTWLGAAVAVTAGAVAVSDGEPAAVLVLGAVGVALLALTTGIAFALPASLRQARPSFEELLDGGRPHREAHAGLQAAAIAVAVFVDLLVSSVARLDRLAHVGVLALSMFAAVMLANVAGRWWDRSRPTGRSS